MDDLMDLEQEEIVSFRRRVENIHKEICSSPLFAVRAA